MEMEHPMEFHFGGRDASYLLKLSTNRFFRLNGYQPRTTFGGIPTFFFRSNHLKRKLPFHLRKIPMSAAHVDKITTNFRLKIVSHSFKISSSGKSVTLTAFETVTTISACRQSFHFLVKINLNITHLRQLRATSTLLTSLPLRRCCGNENEALLLDEKGKFETKISDI